MSTPTNVTINGVPSEDFERPARELHEALLRANYVRCGTGGWTFNGWTADGVPVHHRIKVEGYARSGPRVEKERAERHAKGIGIPNPGKLAEELYYLGFEGGRVLTPQERSVLAEFARGFEECTQANEELLAMTDAELVSAVYFIMSDYAKGQM